jgi:hypothetical protein
VSEMPEFRAFGKLHRLFRDTIITEKLDGTNAQVTVLEDGRLLAGSRNRWITPEADNFGFAAWVKENEDELRSGLGVGTHFGEWVGKGIQRGYGMEQKRFALFNVSLWSKERPACCDVVPTLSIRTFSESVIRECAENLAKYGSVYAPGFMKPEGIVVFHSPSNTAFKYTLDKNDDHKGAA